MRWLYFSLNLFKDRVEYRSLSLTPTKLGCYECKDRAKNIMRRYGSAILPCNAQVWMCHFYLQCAGMDVQMLTLSCRFSVRSAGKSTHILDFDKRDVWLRFADVGKCRNSFFQHSQPFLCQGRLGAYVLFHCHDEGIGLELATHFCEVQGLYRAVLSVETESCTGA